MPLHRRAGPRGRGFCASLLLLPLGPGPRRLALGGAAGAFCSILNVGLALVEALGEASSLSLVLAAESQLDRSTIEHLHVLGPQYAKARGLLSLRMGHSLSRPDGKFPLVCHRSHCVRFKMCSTSLLLRLPGIWRRAPRVCTNFEGFHKYRVCHDSLSGQVSCSRVLHATADNAGHRLCHTGRGSSVMEPC